MLRCLFFFSSRRRHTRCSRDWSSDVCSSDLYVDLGPFNGGIMLNVSEGGFRFCAVSPLRPNEKIHFAFAVDKTRRLEGTGQLEWTEENGKVAGLQFTDVSEEFRREIRQWLTKSQPSVGAGREFIPATAAPVHTLEKSCPDLKAEPPKVQPASPLVEKPELKIEAPPAAAAAADTAEHQRSSESVQPRKLRTPEPPIEGSELPKMLHAAAPKEREEAAAQSKAAERKRPKELAAAKEVQKGSSPRLSRAAAVGIGAAVRGALASGGGGAVCRERGGGAGVGGGVGG